jgi:uncharacterized protein YraI
MRSTIALAVLMAVAVGCTMNQATPGAPTAPAAVSATPAAAAVSDTPLPVPATAVPTSTAVPTATAFVPFTVSTWADNVLLRSNPGYLFPQLAVLRKGASLSVLGKSPGAEWLLCQTSDSRVGWVFAQLVERAGGVSMDAPSIWPTSVQTLVGKVNDQAGVPISGIQFSIVQGAGDNAPRTDAMTDDSGAFYGFMPADARGTWFVSYTAVSCESNTMDASCNCQAGVCGSPDPKGVNVDFPRAADDPLTFVWR